MKRWRIYGWLTLAATAAVMPLLMGATWPLGGYGGGGTSDVPTPVLPDTIPVAIDRELNLWYDNAAPSFGRESSVSWMAYADTAGFQLDRCWRWNPKTVDAQTLRLRPVDTVGNLGAITSTVVASVSKTAGYGGKNVLLFGDSLFDGDASAADSTTVSMVASLVDTLLVVTDGGPTVKFIGTQGISFADALDEGRSGYKTSTFTSSWANNGHAYNPFWDSANGRVSFQKYCTNRSQRQPIDAFVMMLGWNDVGAWGAVNATQAQINATLANIDTLATVATSQYRGWTTAHFIICLPPLGSLSMSEFGRTNTAATTTGISRAAWPYMLKNMIALHRAIISRYDGRRFAPHVDVCPVSLWVDRVYGYSKLGSSAFKVSDRWPNAEQGKTRDRDLFQYFGYPHPSWSGRDQEADAIYSHLRYVFAQQGAVRNLLVDSENFLNSAAWDTVSHGEVGGCGSMVLGEAVADPWGIAGGAQRWATAGNDRERLSCMYSQSGITLGAWNVFACYFATISGSGKFQIKIDAASGTDYNAQWVQSTNSALLGYCEPNTGGAGDTPNGWVWAATRVGSTSWFRCYAIFPHTAGIHANQLRISLDSTVNSASANVSLYGADFRKYTTQPTIPDVYQRVP